VTLEEVFHFWPTD